ncbi:MAG TPA: hypothetical protein VGQ30_00920 [Gemmatimonadaceae bacterium]|jgi:uncharacterized membrane protein YiaA|nr:hypothetical protein [Gemmatimonadaceae bacterium]
MRTLHARAATSRVVALVLFTVVARYHALGAQQPAPHISVDSLTRALASLRESADSAWIPAAASFTFGDSTIAAGRTAKGAIAVAGGTVHVRGVLDGDAITYGGDIIVHQGGEIRGNAHAILGKVVLDGGVVGGDVASLAGDLKRARSAPPGEIRSTGSATMHALALAGGWLAVLVIVGIGVLIFASPNIDAVSDALERGFGRAFLAGIATQLALAPALALLCVGLALTILGALLIPFAIVAYVLAAAGLVTLGYLALARIAGRSILGETDQGAGVPRAVALRSLVYGLALLMIPWFVAGGLNWSPTIEVFARMIAVAITWVAATAGLGAAVVSRGGVKRAAAPAAQRAMNTASWATPTPVSGVTAARRPTPFTTSAPK